MTRAITSFRARLGACRRALVDSTVLLDVATNDPDHTNVLVGRGMVQKKGVACGGLKAGTGIWAGD